MSISLEHYIRQRLDEIESAGEYCIATDSVRAWIDLHNELKEPLSPSEFAERIQSNCTHNFIKHDSQFIKCQNCGLIISAR